MTDHKYIDSHGKALEDYPQPSVAVDTAVLSLDADNELVVLLVRRPSGRGWALPGTFLHDRERLAHAVDRCLQDKANIRGLRPRQLQVFDKPGRDKRGWVLSVAHIQVVQPHQLESRSSERTTLALARDPGKLPYDHPEIVEYALADLRARYVDRPDPDGLLGEEFTLRELRSAHEAVAGHNLDRDAFRRLMEPLIQPTGTFVNEGRGRPAQKFRRGSPPARRRRRGQLTMPRDTD
ncbi:MULTISPECIES: NUDIX hydrolase [Mycobacterium]|uniref:NUDIX hydrolase n=1 Tax=Mycobacterium kiyosense TaxID=2871094 RepID=A0A9P3Q7B6_9MYCO|nr:MULTISPECIES: NUDIX domain-containing protein [Mycobacterium]BDB41914.1 NUDIX hydrolase [Mycobacterium kiyosense]BDE14796.1 NUDIX hydrolase [Mycobacterium sp. 20KCMC460]GLB84214.1 NUDIX hydrolase [Mycobacterium kiyosense]GLB91743.1 NUDIX hydrolase [Mycobacterium kiyosense]GLB96740.1 NUDIX hydrolase [Mycobacterium kiyosense]